MSTRAKRQVTIYPIAGQQLFFRVPDSWCEECGPHGAADEPRRLRARQRRVRIKPWFNHLFDALRRGGWHAPVVTIDGKIFTQGIVPDETELRRALGAGA